MHSKTLKNIIKELEIINGVWCKFFYPFTTTNCPFSKLTFTMFIILSILLKMVIEYVLYNVYFNNLNIEIDLELAFI